MPVLTTPLLLTATHQKDLTGHWENAVVDGLRQTHGNVSAAGGGAPQEPDYVYGILATVVPTMQREMASVFGPLGRTVSLAGVFCHQSPYISFPPARTSSRRPSPPISCELGDLLVVTRYVEPHGEEINALLLQFKMGDWPTPDPHDPQWRLYTCWPPFDWVSRPYFHRAPHPRGPHAGALFAMIESDHDRVLARAADPAARTRRLSTMLAGTTFMFGGRPVKPRLLARAERQGGWSEVVWDLLEQTASRLLTRKRSGLVGRLRPQRGIGDAAFVHQGPGMPALLRDTLLAAGATSDEVDELVGWDGGRDRVDTAVAPDAPDADGISTLIIEISSGAS